MVDSNGYLRTSSTTQGSAQAPAISFFDCRPSGTAREADDDAMAMRGGSTLLAGGEECTTVP